MNKKNTLLIIIAICLYLNGFSQAPVYSNAFLDIGVGARALGMSNTCVASVNDVTAGYWNPAGLTDIGYEHQATLMHSEYFAGIAKYDYGAYATRLDSTSVLALSVVRFGVDNIPNTSQLIDANGNINYNLVSSFSATDLGIIISYAKKVKIPGLRLGANAKIIRRTVGDFAGAWGFGLDVGAQYDYKKWKFAAMARDISTTFNAWSFNIPAGSPLYNTLASTGNLIPQSSVEITLPTLILGAARKFDLTKKISLLAEVDMDATFDGARNVLIHTKVFSADPHMGIEASYMNFIFIRAGIGNYQKSTDASGDNIQTVQPNIGIGVRIKSFTIDYALTNLGEQGGGLYSNVFSVKMILNKNKR